MIFQVLYDDIFTELFAYLSREELLRSLFTNRLLNRQLTKYIHNTQFQWELTKADFLLYMIYDNAKSKSCIYQI